MTEKEATEIGFWWLVGVALLQIAFVFFLVAGAGYIFARVYLVVEAFISLRSPPKGAFETVRWMDYWPHF